MGEADDKMLKAIKHYQESLERNTKTGKSEKLLHAIGKLSLLPIRVWHLEETGVGRTVNGLKKFEGTVGEQARNLVDKWKFMVKGEEEEEKEQNELKSIKVEKIDAVPVQESPQRATRETKCDDDKRYHSSNHSKSKSSHGDSQSSRHCESKATNSEDKSHKRHNYKSSPSDSEIASKRNKVIKTEVKQNHSKYSDKSSESESDDSDSSNQSSSRRTQSESSHARSTSGSSDNSSSDSSGSSSSDEDDSDKNHNRKRHSSNDSDSDGYSHKKSNDSRNEKQSKSNGASSEYSKIQDSKKKFKNNYSDSSDADGTALKHKEKPDKYIKQSTSKNDETRLRHHNSKSESSKSKHTSEKSREPESKSSSSDHKKSEHRESVRGQDKSKDRGSHRSSTKSGKSEDNKKNDSNQEKPHKEKKDDKSETTRKRSREESSSRESKKCKTSSDTNDSRRSHDHSSSSKKDRDKHSVKDEKQKEPYKQSKDKKIVSETIKDKSAESKSNKIPKKLLDGIDSGSGTSFADVLGMLEAPVYSKSKKKSSANDETIPSSSKKTSSVPREDKTARGSKPISESPSFKTNGEIPNLLKDPAGLDPLDINMSSLLPSITPNYRPLGVTLESSRPMYMDDEAFSRVITAKHQRTKVYSGNKAGFTKVPTLFDLCSRILQDNLDALEYTGGVPYSILKPILEKANPNQLYMLEFHNPYLIEDTDELWQLHCQKEFRNKKREELESWREMYLRCLDEREAKLKALTANIKQSQDKSIPVRQTKLAYVDSVVKPPRNIARKQKPSQTPTERLNQLAKSGEASKIAVPNPSRSAVERSSSSSSHIKPKKAPLMAKTLSLLKNRFGRR
ncbi:hypothetical protein HUJ05_012172 [Dendroctonus ponderosae]|nr:hypothetical protein HUJ05_012172 [Dendroctonus ponderosae]KAH1013140.1 hypothetical protein HUJ05_012172 [Dendroctonus ponderosae]KAH1013141.1 hypothetical protein HUJ05_012172 [Dendroctonus ponderosae]